MFLPVSSRFFPPFRCFPFLPVSPSFSQFLPFFARFFPFLPVSPYFFLFLPVFSPLIHISSDIFQFIWKFLANYSCFFLLLSYEFRDSVFPRFAWYFFIYFFPNSSNLIFFLKFWSFLFFGTTPAGCNNLYVVACMFSTKVFISSYKSSHNPFILVVDSCTYIISMICEIYIFLNPNP